MTIVGLDFDNTLVRYDNIFHALALEKGLIPRTLEKNKEIIRARLKEDNKEDEFTLMQGGIR